MSLQKPVVCTDESDVCAQMRHMTCVYRWVISVCADESLTCFWSLESECKTAWWHGWRFPIPQQKWSKMQSIHTPLFVFFPGAFGRPNVPQDRGIRWCRSCGRCASLGRVGRPRHAHAPQPTPPSIDSIVVFPSAGLGTSYESPQGKAYYLSIYCIWCPTSMLSGLAPEILQHV